jgi:hypothetical protein
LLLAQKAILRVYCYAAAASSQDVRRQSNAAGALIISRMDLASLDRLSESTEVCPEP